MVYEFDFKKKHDNEKLKKEAERIIAKYPDRIPVIVEKNKDSKDTPDIDKHKFLVPSDLTMGQFMYIIRKRVKINESQALFIFTDAGHLVTSATLLSQVYKQYQDVDTKFLYLVYSSESTFGNN